MEEKRTNLFANFAFYFHGSAPAAKYLKSTLLPRHGGAVADARTLDSACRAACRSGGPESYGKHGRLEVVVVCGSRTAGDPREAREKAQADIRGLLGKASLVCPQCKRCHLLCTTVSNEGVPFVHESIEIQSPQTQVACFWVVSGMQRLRVLYSRPTSLHASDGVDFRQLLQDFDVSTANDPARIVGHISAAKAPSDSNKSASEDGVADFEPEAESCQRESNYAETGRQREDAIIVPDGDDHILVSDDSDQEVEIIEDTMEVETGLDVNKRKEEEGKKERAGARERGSEVVLKHIECPANERFVRHLDLLSFLLDLNVKSSTRRSEVYHPKQGEKEHAKVGSWAFKQAANVIRRLPDEIMIRGDDDQDIYLGGFYEKRVYCIGKSTKNELCEVQSTGTSRRLQNLQSAMPYYPTIQEIMLVHGIGVSLAVRLYNHHHIRSWQELRRRMQRLPDGGGLLESKDKKMKFHSSTLLCLSKFESLHEEKLSTHRHEAQSKAWALRRISREQVEKVRKYIHECAQRIGGNKVLQTAVGGSHRRGLTTTGDIDLVMQGLDGWESDGLLEGLVKVLAEQDVVLHFLEPSDLKWLGYDSNDSSQGCIYFAQRYMGLVNIAKIPTIGCLQDRDGGWRRLDITIYERKCFLYGLFQWTGSTQLNREMRRVAVRQGKVFNEFGIFYNQPTSTNKTVPGAPVAGCFDISDERGLFKLLDMEYLEPHERNHGSRSVARLAEAKLTGQEDLLEDMEDVDDELCWMDD